MALASLCGEISQGAGFTGFIVDHELRKGSTEEAQNVATELKRLNIQPRILTLDWSRDGDPASQSHIESLARRLRYQALGKACHEQGIRTLLVAHHADDQAETILLRIVGKYYGSALRGIRPEAAIPECRGIYGVHASGDPWSSSTTNAAESEARKTMLMEDCGVTLARPLLPFTKQQLTSYCQDADVKWFEDETNADRTFTMRNTVRYLQKNELLPTALRKKSLLAAALRVNERYMQAEEVAENLYRGTNIRLDLGTGSATFTTDGIDEMRAGTAAWAGDLAVRYKAILLLVRKLLSLVAPVAEIHLQRLHAAAELIFPDAKEAVMEEQKETALQIAGVAIRRLVGQDRRTWYSMQRQPPPASRIAATKSDICRSLRVKTGSLYGETNWQLWDERYWVRVGRLRAAPKSSDWIDVSVRFLLPTDIAQLRRKLPNADRKKMQEHLRTVPGDMRYTLPAIVVLSPGGVESVVALPSLGWSDDKWSEWPGFGRGDHGGSEWVWDIRYRKVDFPASEGHRSVDDGARRLW